MSFQIRSLSDIQKDQKRDFEKARNLFRRNRHGHLRYYIIVPLVFILIFFAVRAASWTYQSVASFSMADLVWSLSSDIPIEDNHTTVLLLGHAGGNHGGPDLTDTIIVATLDHRLHTVSLLSIPRDLFISVSGYEPTRINALWKLGQMRNEKDEEGYELIRAVVEEIIGEPIHYHVRVDFRGFEKIIDTLGGITIDVDTSFTDHNYPTADFGYQTVSFPLGLQHMNGERALQYARSRHGNNEQGSDFQRALRQQKILMAIRDKALSSGTLTDPEKLRDIYDAINSTFQTDLDLREILAFAKFGSELSRDNVFSFTLSDGFDGFLYTPDEIDRLNYYGGQYVLLPIGNDWNIIHDFINLIWHHGELYKENAKISILNGTNIQGLAQTCMSYLKRYHLNPVEVGNATDLYPRSEIYDHTLNVNPVTLNVLQKLVNGNIVSQLSENQPTQSDISLIIGKDTTCKTW